MTPTRNREGGRLRPGTRPRAAFCRPGFRAAPGRAGLVGDRGGRFPPTLARTPGSDLTTAWVRERSAAVLRPVLPGLRSLRRVALGRADRAHATSPGRARDVRDCPTSPGSVLRDGRRDARAGERRRLKRSYRPRLHAGMLSRGVTAARQAGLSAIRWVQADASALPFKDGVFDAVVCAYALYELKGPTRGAMLQEVARALSPGGDSWPWNTRCRPDPSPDSCSRCGWRSSARKGPGRFWEARCTSSVGCSRGLRRRYSRPERARSSRERKAVGSCRWGRRGAPSWRLGRSLGVDPLGSSVKRCTYDCIYCQLGRTPGGPVRIGAWADPSALADELRAIAHVPVDYVTFSGMGEPTLASNLGELLQVARVTRKTRLAVLTNASLLGDPDVRAALSLADCVVAKLDAADEEAFLAINRPRIPCSLAEVVGGIREFREGFAGRLALQLMFLAGNAGQAEQLAALVRSLQPDEVQLNTPLRPSPVAPLEPAALALVARSFEGLPAHQVYAIAGPVVVALDPVATRQRRPEYGGCVEIHSVRAA